MQCSYDGRTGTRESILQECVLDLIYARLLPLPTQSEGHVLPKLSISLGDVDKAISQVRDWKEGTSYLLQGLPANVRSSVDKTLRRLARLGVLKERTSDSGQRYELPTLDSQELQALLATRASLDALVASRWVDRAQQLLLVTPPSAIEHLKAPNLEKAEACLADQERQLALFAKQVSSYEAQSEEEIFRLVRMRMGFIRADCSFHLALADGLHLDFLKDVYQGAHMVPDLNFIRPITQSPNSAKKSVTLMDENITEHRAILYAFAAVWETLRSAASADGTQCSWLPAETKCSSMERERIKKVRARMDALGIRVRKRMSPSTVLDLAFRLHLAGTFDHWNAAGIGDSLGSVTYDQLHCAVLPTYSRSQTPPA